MPRLMMSRPFATSALARASTAKAFSSPIRSKAAIVRSITALLRGGAVPPRGRGGLSNEARSSADQEEKIKRRQGFPPQVFSAVATEPPANITPDLKTDIRIGIIAEIDAAEIERPGGKFVGTPILHCRR